MEDTAERKLSFAIRRPRGYLHDMMRTMHDAGPGHLFLAVHDGSPLADVFTFSEKYRFTHGVSSTEKRSYNPNHLLQWEVMRWAIERGIKYYDLVGSPEPENRNVNNPYNRVYRFKIGLSRDVTDFVGAWIYRSKTPARKPSTTSSRHTAASTTSSGATCFISAAPTSPGALSARFGLRAPLLSTPASQACRLTRLADRIRNFGSAAELRTQGEALPHAIPAKAEIHHAEGPVLRKGLHCDAGITPGPAPNS
jgi:Acetyltransferase (GNAT) domain